ncbi:MAG TPA: helix-turn-helix domain-containing protein [Burkholderiales bacterium]|jgi:DNA-binding transcriptional MerR regulator
MQTTSQVPEPVRIGELSEQTGCSVPTIRYYEEIGLIPPARRRSSGHRVYDASAARQLGFVRRCRDFGFTLEQIRLLASLSRDPRRDCAEARDLAQEHLKGVRAKMLELMALERTLARFIDACDQTCAGGCAPDCTLFRDLAPPEAAVPKPSGCCA